MSEIDLIESARKEEKTEGSLSLLERERKKREKTPFKGRAILLKKVPIEVVSVGRDGC